MFTDTNFKTKQALKEALAEGGKIAVWHPGLAEGEKEIRNGIVSLEGPHCPAPRKWCARAVLKDGYVVELI